MAHVPRGARAGTGVTCLDGQMSVVRATAELGYTAGRYVQVSVFF